MKDIENVHSPSAIMKHLPRVWAPYWLLAYTVLNNLCIKLEIQVVLNWVNVNVGFLHFKVSLFPLLKAIFQSELKPATIDARSAQHRCLTQKVVPVCPFSAVISLGVSLNLGLKESHMWSPASSGPTSWKISVLKSLIWPRWAPPFSSLWLCPLIPGKSSELLGGLVVCHLARISRDV